MRATAMRKYLRFLLFLPLFVCFLALAKPVRVSAGDDWQPISPDDLALKDNPKSPGADAMILYRESSIDENSATISEYTRIKIFTKAGGDKIWRH